MHSDSEELDPTDTVALPLLAKSPSLPSKMQKSVSQYKLNRQPRVTATASQYHSLDASTMLLEGGQGGGQEMGLREWEWNMDK